MADVFFCYSHNDVQTAEHWAQRLQAAGISVWMDPRGAQGSTVWTQEIVQAIEECSVMVVLLSRGSVHSHNVVKEVSLASERGKGIVPVKLEPVEIPSTMQYQLGHIPAVELFESLDVAGIEQSKANALLAALAKHGLATPAPETEELPQSEPNEVQEESAGQPQTSPSTSRKSWKQFQANATLKAKMFWLAVRFYAKRFWKGYRALHTKIQVVIGAGAGVVLLLLILWIGWPTSGKAGTAFSAKAMPQEQLNLAVQRVTLEWQKGGFGGIEGRKNAHGVAGVYRKRAGKLYMVTQASTAALDEIVKTESVPPLKIKSYQLEVASSSNFRRQAERFAYKPGGLDLAVLEINASGMKDGGDYVLLPYRPGAELDEEDEVMLLHWIPLEGDFIRQTPQRIMGRRKISVDGREIWVYQIGSGHKTGLVVKKDGDGFFWVGVIAYHDGGASYAMLPADFLKLDPKFYFANREGAAQAVKEVLNFPAVGKD